MILAGGRGTRLGSLAERTPKILVEIGGEPLLARQLRYLEREGVERVVVNAHHLAEQVEDFLDGYRGPLEVVLLVEEQLKGTAGAVRNALKYLEDPVVVLYGDVLLDAPLAPLLAAHSATHAVATLTVYAADSTAGKGVVDVGEDGRIQGFAEKERTGRGLVNAGLYVLDRAFVASLPEGATLDFGTDVLPSAVGKGAPVFAATLGTPAIDVGTPAGLSAARAVVADAARAPTDARRTARDAT